MKFGWVFLLIPILSGCGDKKNSGDGEAVMEVQEFLGLFKPAKLPITFADSSFNNLSKDTSFIQRNVLAQFVGDSILGKNFGNARPKIYPVARVNVKRAETYLFAKAVSASRKVAYLFVFDRDNNFKASLPMLIVDNDPLTSQTAAMDSRYTISLNRQRKRANGDLGYKKDAYVYNNVGVFTLIMTESNEDLGAGAEIINPLDSLPRKNKFSGDYFVDNKNFVSVRDGQRASQLRFFIHFEKSKGSCKGELRGEATLTKPNVALYRESGDPCVLEFSFGTNAVTMTEVEGCGNYRDIKCFFEGTYPRKKEKPKPSKKK
jgi:hypothetical protein